MIRCSRAFLRGNYPLLEGQTTNPTTANNEGHPRTDMVSLGDAGSETVSPIGEVQSPSGRAKALQRAKWDANRAKAVAIPSL